VETDDVNTKALRWKTRKFARSCVKVGDVLGSKDKHDGCESETATLSAGLFYP